MGAQRVVVEQEGLHEICLQQTVAPAVHGEGHQLIRAAHVAPAARRHTKLQAGALDARALPRLMPRQDLADGVILEGAAVHGFRVGAPTLLVSGRVLARELAALAETRGVRVAPRPAVVERVPLHRPPQVRQDARRGRQHPAAGRRRLAAQLEQRLAAVAQAPPRLGRDGDEGQLRVVAHGGAPEEVRLVVAGGHAVAAVGGRVGSLSLGHTASKQASDAGDLVEVPAQHVAVASVAIVLRNDGQHSGMLRHLQAAVKEESPALDEVGEPVVQHCPSVRKHSPFQACHHGRSENLRETI
mmetsp:Transcript_1010/g.3121  ORF Transcript_1010/g.3121 Transcript_1010/m.3121 type:complete len:299 (-) Transcript_1010:1130-2026(-)